MMMEIKEIIVVEGKNDSKILKTYFKCSTIETGGTHLSEETLKMIQKAQETRGVIIFTDPDSPGEKIRSMINQRINGCKNAFINKEEAKTSKKVGIEHAAKEDIQKALEHCMTYNSQVEKGISLQDLMDLKLNGHPDSKELRLKVGKILQIGKCNAKTFCQRCNMMKISKEELEKVVKQ